MTRAISRRRSPPMPIRKGLRRFSSIWKAAGNFSASSAISAVALACAAASNANILEVSLLETALALGRKKVTSDHPFLVGVVFSGRSARGGLFFNLLSAPRPHDERGWSVRFWFPDDDGGRRPKNRTVQCSELALLEIVF